MPTIVMPYLTIVSDQSSNFHADTGRPTANGSGS